jgi:hypothetical protein
MSPHIIGWKKTGLVITELSDGLFFLDDFDGIEEVDGIYSRAISAWRLSRLLEASLRRGMKCVGVVIQHALAACMINEEGSLYRSSACRVHVRTYAPAPWAWGEEAEEPLNWWNGTWVFASRGWIEIIFKVVEAARKYYRGAMQSSWST